MREKDRIG